MGGGNPPPSSRDLAWKTSRMTDRVDLEDKEALRRALDGGVIMSNVSEPADNGKSSIAWSAAPGRTSVNGPIRQQHDPGIAIVELLAFVGDLIAAHQDLIADEAYLGTSRHRRTGIRVDIGGERWRAVPSLADSGPDDQHYVVTTRDDGAAVIQFGDGKHGRRPSKGSEIRVRYRSGGRYTSVLLQQDRVTIDARDGRAPAVGGSAVMPRNDGILDEVTGKNPPPPLGPCSGVNVDGSRCRNQGRYWVQGNLSCSRRHQSYRSSQ